MREPLGVFIGYPHVKIVKVKQMDENSRDKITRLAAEAGAAKRNFENLGFRNYRGTAEELAKMDGEYELARTEMMIAEERLRKAQKNCIWENS